MWYISLGWFLLGVFAGFLLHKVLFSWWNKRQIKKLEKELGIDSDMSELSDYIYRVSRAEDLINELSELSEESAIYMFALNTPSSNALHSRSKRDTAYNLLEVERQKLKVLKEMGEIGAPKSLQHMSSSGSDIEEISIPEAIEMVTEIVDKLEQQLDPQSKEEKPPKPSHLRIIKDD